MLCDSGSCLNSMANIDIFVLADNLSGWVKVSHSKLVSVGCFSQCQLFSKLLLSHLRSFLCSCSTQWTVQKLGSELSFCSVLEVSGVLIRNTHGTHRFAFLSSSLCFSLQYNPVPWAFPFLCSSQKSQPS